MESSAYWVHLLPFNILFISATHKLKRTGPRIDPCGTPKFIYKMLEMFESIQSGSHEHNPDIGSIWNVY